MKCGFFMMQVFLNAVRYGLLFILSLVLIVVGAIWSAVCLYIGLGLLLLYLLLCFASAIQNSRTVKRLSEENPEMQTMLDQLMTDPNAFLSDITGEYDEKKKLHGQELLTLSDDDLFETVYFQNLDIAESAEDLTGKLRFVNPKSHKNGIIYGEIAEFDKQSLHYLKRERL